MSPTAPHTRRIPAPLRVVIALHIALAFMYSWLIPLDRGPDEPHHLDYVAHLSRFRELPQLTSPTASRDERTGAIAIHPPLYYVAAWPLYELALRVAPSTVEGEAPRPIGRLFRWLAILFGATTVWLIWLMVATLFPDRPEVALAAATFAAFLPEFQLLSAVMNNDGPMMLVSTLLIYQLILRLDRPTPLHVWALLGVLGGVTIMTKASGLATAPTAMVLLAYHIRTQRLSRMEAVKRVAAYYLPMVAIAGWWFLNLYQRFGRLHPISRDIFAGSPLLHESPLDLLTSDRAWLCIKRLLIGSYQSLWGQVDWFIPINQATNAPLFGVALFEATLALYLVFAMLSVVAVVGLVVAVVRNPTPRPPSRIGKGEMTADLLPLPESGRGPGGWVNAGLLLLAVHFALAYAALAHFTLFQHPGGFQGGRYLYPSVAAFATLFVVGLSAVTPTRFHRWLAPSLLVLMLLWNLGCAFNLVAYLNPTHAPGLGIEWPRLPSRERVGSTIRVDRANSAGR